MPRTARLDAPGVLHHVMGRGLDRQVIFRDDHDQDDFVRRLAGLVEATGTNSSPGPCSPNHVHFTRPTTLFQWGYLSLGSV